MCVDWKIDCVCGFVVAQSFLSLSLSVVDGGLVYVSLWAHTLIQNWEYYILAAASFFNERFAYSFFGEKDGGWRISTYGFCTLIFRNNLKKLFSISWRRFILFWNRFSRNSKESKMKRRDPKKKLKKKTLIFYVSTKLSHHFWKIFLKIGNTR